MDPEVLLNHSKHVGGPNGLAYVNAICLAIQEEDVEMFNEVLKVRFGIETAELSN